MRRWRMRTSGADREEAFRGHLNKVNDWYDPGLTGVHHRAGARQYWRKQEGAQMETALRLREALAGVHN